MSSQEKGNVILMTGVTGFIGSSLAATFLAKGDRVIALARNDSDGFRTSMAVLRASRGLPVRREKRKGRGASPDQETDVSNQVRDGILARLSVLPFDLAALETNASYAEMLSEVTEIWHFAAEMSFSPRKLESSFATNVGISTRLWDLAIQKSPLCKRYYYVSTAYTAGTDSRTFKEELHARPNLINPYQVTKWSTEMSLSEQSRKTPCMALTIFRPAIVVGDSQTGVYAGQSFGIYMYFFALGVSKTLGAKSLTLDLDLNSTINLVPLEVLISNAAALSIKNRRADFENDNKNHNGPQIIHGTGIPVQLGPIIQIMKKILTIEVFIGTPESTLDLFSDSICQWVKRFANGNIQFDDSNLREILGDEYQETKLGDKELETLLSWYRTHLVQFRTKKITKRLIDSELGKKSVKIYPKLPEKINDILHQAYRALQLSDEFSSKEARMKMAKRLLKLAR